MELEFDEDGEWIEPLRDPEAEADEDYEYLKPTRGNVET